MFVTQRVYGRFYGLDLKKEMFIIDTDMATLDSSIQQNALALDLVQVLESSNYFLFCQGKHSSVHVCCHSLSPSDSE